MAETRYLSFEETLERLGLVEDDLLNLVAANEIRAFRIDREMKFKEVDIQSIKQKSGGDAAAPLAVSAPTAEMDSVVDLSDSGELEIVSDDDDLALVDSAADVSEPDDETLQTVALADETNPELLGETDDSPTELSGEVEGGEDGDTEEFLTSSGSDGLGTEEIVFEDEDLAIGNLDDLDLGTQEVTVREDAISDEELTTVESGDSDSGGDAAPALRRPSVRRSGRLAGVSGRSSVGSMRRKALVESGRAKGNPIITGVMVITILMMLYPLSMYITVARQGFSSRNDTTPSGIWKNTTQVPSLGVPFIPSQLNGFVKMEVGGKRPYAWWGDKTNPYYRGGGVVEKTTDDEGTTEDADDTNDSGDADTTKNADE